MIIAIDGPSGTGKSTVAQRVAKKLGFLYFNTGAMYRCFAYLLIQKKIAFHDSQAILEMLDKFYFDIQLLEGEYHYFLEGEDVSLAIRQEKISESASQIAKNEAVRCSLLPIQRSFGKKRGLVMEGRDIGTVVFPDAELKVFLTARLEVRVDRRLAQLKEKFAQTYDYHMILEEMSARDTADANRSIAPLKQAEDAQLIDTSELSIDQVVNKIVELALDKKGMIL